MFAVLLLCCLSVSYQNPLFLSSIAPLCERRIPCSEMDFYPCEKRCDVETTHLSEIRLKFERNSMDYISKQCPFYLKHYL